MLLEWRSIQLPSKYSSLHNRLVQLSPLTKETSSEGGTFVPESHYRSKCREYVTVEGCSSHGTFIMHSPWPKAQGTALKRSRKIVRAGGPGNCCEGMSSAHNEDVTPTTLSNYGCLCRTCTKPHQATFRHRWGKSSRGFMCSSGATGFLSLLREKEDHVNLRAGYVRSKEGHEGGKDWWIGSKCLALI